MSLNNVYYFQFCHYVHFQFLNKRYYVTLYSEIGGDLNIYQA